MGKIEKEQRIVGRMIHLYCQKKHHTVGNLCRDCETLKKYACERLSACQFKELKTTCKACSVHCYQKDKRNDIRRVMKFSGPRMLLYYPLDLLKHFLGGHWIILL